MNRNSTIPSTGPMRVLVTGAYGLIGNLVYKHLAENPESYEPFAMVRRVQPSSRATHESFYPIPEERVRLADLTDFEAVCRAVEGIDTIVHMAADPDGRSGWESILNNNIIGSQHVFEAARLAGVKRILYASSNTVAFGYFKEEPYRSLNPWPPNVEAAPAPYTPVHHTMPTRPTSYYACSKVFGEALANMYSQVHGLSCICLRIGWVLADNRPPHPSARSIWLSHRDCVQMIACCLQAPEDLRFDVFFVQSNNARNFVDIQHARDVVGYDPQDRAEDYL